MGDSSECLNDSGGPRGVEGDVFLFYPVDGQRVLTESGPAEKGTVLPFFFFTNGSVSSLFCAFYTEFEFLYSFVTFSSSLSCVSEFVFFVLINKSKL